MTASDCLGPDRPPTPPPSRGATEEALTAHRWPRRRLGLDLSGHLPGDGAFYLSTLPLSLSLYPSSLSLSTLPLSGASGVGFSSFLFLHMPVGHGGSSSPNWTAAVLPRERKDRFMAREGERERESPREGSEVPPPSVVVFPAIGGAGGVPSGGGGRILTGCTCTGRGSRVSRRSQAGCSPGGR